MTQEQLRNLNTIVTTYGDDPQMDMCIEECAELQKALLKYRRKKKGFSSDDEVKTAKANVVDELADVCVMVEQMKIVYGYEAVEERIKFKIDRQMDRLRNRGREDADKTGEG